MAKSSRLQACSGDCRVCFCRNGGHGGKRPVFLSDHHLLHYLVTVACCMHVFYILAAMRANA